MNASATFRLPSALLFLATAGLPLVAQTPPAPDPKADTRRALATRKELEASLAQIDSVIRSPGYSSRIRESKQREAALIRERLTEGDFQVGDQVALQVLGEEAFSNTFMVEEGRVLVLPGLAPIPLRGVLRSEGEQYLAEQLGKYVRNPAVTVTTTIRLGVLGSVNKQGFYQVGTDMLVSDAIMVAGGPAGIANPNKTKVIRSGVEILDQDDMAQAIVQGATLDQLNLRAGDQIVVDEHARRGPLWRSVLAVIGAVASVGFLIDRIL